MEELKYIVTPDTINRIDRFLAGQISDLSRSYIQKLIKDGQITVNGNPIKQNYKLAADDVVSVLLPELESPDIVAENIPLDVLYEDQDILIVNKPKGMVVHPSAGHYSGTLVNAVLYHCKDNLSGINGVLRPGIVHRIDKDTTGSIIVCKNDASHQAVAAQLKTHSLKRVYHAIVHGVIKTDSGTIEGPIGRHPEDRKKMCINQRNGKPAITHYKVLHRFDKFTYIQCELETGRTHQIRVHMASIRHPLLGDSVYGPSKCPVKGLEGQCLHAKIIGIMHPATGSYIEIDAPLPEYFTLLLRKLGYEEY